MIESVEGNFDHPEVNELLKNHLIDKEKKLGIKRLSIETGAGEFFAPARKLFDKCGFRPCSPFAHYKKDINSLYLTKLIDNT